MSNDPAAKYRDQVDPEHRIAMQSIGMSRLMMSQYQAHFERLIKSRQDMDSFGGLIDPTLYQDVLQSKSLEQQLRLVRAALAFLSEVNAVAGEIGGEAA